MINKIKSSTAWRMGVILVLGFASGLPLALTGTALQAWMTVNGLDISAIGFISLVGLPYTFKFIWAPLMDRFEPPFLGRRRGWLVLTQLALGGALFLLSMVNPKDNLQAFALIAVLISFFSASQDVVIDAYRTDVMPAKERGIGSSIYVFGYRLAMILSGGIAMMWADTVSGNGWSWPQIYQVMSTIMFTMAGASFLFVPRLSDQFVKPTSDARNDLKGFFALLVAIFIGYQFTEHLANPLMNSALGGLFPDINGVVDPNKKKWVDLASLLLGIAFTLPLAWKATKVAKFETLNRSLANYFTMKGAAAFLGFIILYKLGDAFAGALITPFLMKGVGFAQAEIGVVNKILGIWLTIVGALMGGVIMVKLGLYRSLLAFGILQMISNIGFYMVAILGKGAWGGFELPAFDILLVTLKETTNVDWLLLFAVGLENITGGMGTAAFVAFLMALCNQKFTATQYALLSAFSSVGRVWVGPLSGVLSETIGWPSFFLFSTVMAIPGLAMLYAMRGHLRALETPDISTLTED